MASDRFSLVVDDFGVKYEGKEHADHLMSVLKEHYTVTEDWEGSKYIGITLDWDYEGRKVPLSLPGYNAKALKRFHHEPPAKRQDSPYPHTPPKYGAKQQYVEGPDDSPPLDKADKTFIQQVTGTFLFSGRAVDSPLLTPLSAITSQQGAPTENTMKRTKQFLDFVASQEDTDCPHLPCQQHDPCSAQRCRIPQRTKCTKQSWRTLFPIQ